MHCDDAFILRARLAGEGWGEQEGVNRVVLACALLPDDTASANATLCSRESVLTCVRTGGYRAHPQHLPHTTRHGFSPRLTSNSHSHPTVTHACMHNGAAAVRMRYVSTRSGWLHKKPYRRGTAQRATGGGARNTRTHSTWSLVSAYRTQGA